MTENCAHNDHFNGGNGRLYLVLTGHDSGCMFDRFFHHLSYNSQVQ